MIGVGEEKSGYKHVYHGVFKASGFYFLWPARILKRQRANYGSGSIIGGLRDSGRDSRCIYPAARTKDSSRRGREETRNRLSARR